MTTAGDRSVAPTPEALLEDLAALPYRIAVLCYLYDLEGRLLLLHRRRPPNAGLHSPIGGKLEIAEGESPHACALREIQEEAGLELDPGTVRLSGIVTETAYEGQTHWLIFIYEVVTPIPADAIGEMEIDEGILAWHGLDDVASLPLPETDRTILWPLVRSHRGGFFMVHIDCRVDPIAWQVLESRGAE